MQHFFHAWNTMTGEPVTPKILGQMLQRKRGSMGIRAAAGEIGISAATLSRIENGRIPDIDTLRKVCTWVGVDAAAYLGTAANRHEIDTPGVQVVFKKDRAVTPKTSQALGKLIVAAYHQFAATVDADGHQ
jgi:transcriptional regulator with XRE-family HTH domain